LRAIEQRAVRDRVRQSAPVRPRAFLIGLVLAVLLLVAAGCGSSRTYDVDKTRACLQKQPSLKVSDKVDFIASNALGGAINVRLPGNQVTLSFAEDRQEAERIVRAYERFKGKNIGLEDVLRPTHNIVVLWAAHPSEAAEQTIRDCLK
jgi:hypothetical protein